MIPLISDNESVYKREVSLPMSCMHETDEEIKKRHDQYKETRSRATERILGAKFLCISCAQKVTRYACQNSIFTHE